MIKVELNGIDRTNAIRFPSVRITDRINNGSDTADFIIEQANAAAFKPEVNMDVKIYVDAVLVYGGVIVELDQSLDGHNLLIWDVTCKDYTQYLDRELITERYQNTNVQAVILDLIDRYADTYGFTGDNVGGDTFLVTSISFSELTMSECLTKLAKLTNYSWYVDYAKDIHFFKKNAELAPFNLNDTSENYIFDTLTFHDDFSQIRNKVKVRGGEAIADERSENHAGNGEQTTFPLGNKFSEEPTVEVDGVPVTVGLDYVDDDADFDVMWSFQQKYLRFTAGNIPAAPGGGDTTNIVVTGLPLKPIVVERQNNPSVVKYGVYEFSIRNDTLKSRDEALQYAQAQLQIYADKLRSGAFDTYTPGLRSGQAITITSAKRASSDSFIIQAVSFKQITRDISVWHVELATLKTLSMIDILQQLLTDERINEGEDETLLNFFGLADAFSFGDSLNSTFVVTTTQDYLWEQGNPMSDSYTNPIVWNEFTWA